MSTESHHTGTFDKLFHHKRRDERDDEHKTRSDHEDASGMNHPKKESEMKKFEDDLKSDETKFKNYLDKDEELEEEGKTYGGLM